MVSSLVRMNIYIFIAALINQCGIMPIHPKRTGDDSFKPYLERFSALYGHSVNLPIYLTTLKDDAVGECWKWPDGYREIAVDKSWWKSFEDDDHAREQLIFHELGHCILNRDHSKEKIDVRGYTIPKTMMYPYVIGYQWFYYDYHEYYIKELFDKNTMAPIPLTKLNEIDNMISNDNGIKLDNDVINKE